MKFIGECKALMGEYKLTSNIRAGLMFVVCVACSLYFLYTAYFGPFPSLIQRTFLLLFCACMIFLSKPCLKNARVSIVIDLIFVALTLTGFGYTFFERDHLQMFVGMPNTYDYIFGIICVVCVVEATRRKVGNALPILAGIFVLYGAFGKYLPGILRHAGMNGKAFLTALYMSEEGIFGQPAMAAANFVIAFVLFGAFLSVSGAGDAFTNIAISLFGRMRGGPAKAAVVSSALMGMLSGSAVANVVTTGSFTIPLMKETGYKPASAGAIEAVASTGGQIMPPVMGAAAFIMADTLGVAYWEIVKVSFIPAFLFYLALYFMVDFEAAKTKLKGIAAAAAPNAKKMLLSSGYVLLPILCLVYFLGVARISAQKAAFYTIVLIIFLSFLKRDTRMTPIKFLKALVSGAIGGMEVGIVCGCAGIIISIILRSGLGMQLTSLLIEISGGILIVLMILTMFTSIVLGMGLPTSACYIIVAILIAPAMVKMGVPPMAAHLFAFYYGCLSTITPPVALAAYAGAGLAGASPMETGWRAVRFGLCGFIVPFMFVYGPPLILIGSVFEIVLAVITACIGTYFLAVSLMGYQFTNIPGVLRIVYFVCALCMIMPGWTSDLPGFAGGLILSLINWNIAKRERIA
ncbi:MAG: TRAP transporter permease [Spirochaetales bacterium]|jgi:TRAP transporter 4TM/12TM fusion protein|nr:TRAP transporter permease [Spirochaetales bacterium]